MNLKTDQVPIGDLIRCSRTNHAGFPTYWQRDRGRKTFDIEHLLKDAFDFTALPPIHGFTDSKDYSEHRNLIGPLVLLLRSRNCSLQDKPYRGKLVAYATENVLTQTLCEALYQSNPNVAAYVQGSPTTGLAAVTDFGKGNIAERTAMYVAVAKSAWVMP